MTERQDLRLDSNKTKINHSYLSFLKKQWFMNKYVYIMFVPVILYYFIFHYMTIYGSIIAFKDFSPGRGFVNSPWVGLTHFKSFFNSYYFVRLIRNTFLISIYDVIFSFPAPILLALLLNEVRKTYYKRLVQTVSYLPHFISLVVIVGIILEFTSRNGLINDIVELLGANRKAYMMEPSSFRTIYITSGIWQTVGWGSIIYLATLSNINANLYEASRIDGAGRWRQMWHITLPGISSTVIVLFILRIGRLMTVGYEKIILMYNPIIYETADVISTFVYRKGLLDMSFSYSTAVGVLNSVVNLVFLVSANILSKKVTKTSLW